MQTADTTRTIDIALGGASFITLAITLLTIQKTSRECFCVLRTDGKTRCLRILHSPNKSTTSTTTTTTTTTTTRALQIRSSFPASLVTASVHLFFV